MEMVKQKARTDIKRIVLPETQDIRTIEAAKKIVEEKITEVILIGNELELKEKYEYNFEGITIVDHLQYIGLDGYIKKLCQLRKSKGLTMEKARELLKDPLYFGVMMVKNGDADGMVAGAANSTADTLRPALQIIKTSKDAKIVSSVHIMCLENKAFGYNGILVYGDTALMEDPDAEELSEIAVASAKTFENLIGAEPKVAMLSYSSHGSANSKLVEKVRTATMLAQQKASTYLIDGELQFDSAVIDEIGKKKAPDSKVAGQANVLIFPDLNAGNIGYKMTERFAGALAYGAITQGLAKPINDMSRGCSADDIVGVIAITAVQAQAIV